MKTNTILLALFFLLSSCSSSLVYSPALSLPTQPLSENQIDLQGGAELLPEARPSQYSGWAVPGISGRLAYGFSDRLAIGLRAWGDMSDWDPSTRSGFSLNAQYHWERAPGRYLYLLPRAGIALSGSWIQGYGLSNSLVWQRKRSEKLAYYFGAGIAFGHAATIRFSGNNGDNRQPIGFAGLVHLGLQWAFAKKAYLNLEANPIFLVNTYDQEQWLLLSPQLSIGYTLGPH